MKILYTFFVIVGSLFLLSSFSPSEIRPEAEEAAEFIYPLRHEFQKPSTAPFSKVVIDAGHGGKDNGCNHGHTKEKDIVLSISKKLGRYIQTNMPGVEVIYTRESDVFVPLHKRAAIANNRRADLFLSVHCNIFKNSSVRGTETYVMGIDEIPENLALAKRENEVIYLENNYTQYYNGYDPNTEVGHMIMSMYQDAYRDQSIRFAEMLEKSFNARAGRKSRGVKEAGFVVLKETVMPSVLIETGFLSNPQDKAFLQSSSGQDKMVQAIYSSVREYKSALETEAIANYQPSQPVYKSTPKPRRTEVAKTRPSNSQNNYSNTTSTVISSAKPSEPETVSFKIQLVSSPSTLVTNGGRWQQVPHLEYKWEGDKYRYYATGYSSYYSCIEGWKDLKSKGFNGAIIVAFKGQQKISVTEARTLLNQ